jgi:hypothetical protein
MSMSVRPARAGKPITALRCKWLADNNLRVRAARRQFRGTTLAIYSANAVPQRLVQVDVLDGATAMEAYTINSFLAREAIGAPAGRRHA